MRCITISVLQTKVDARCNKLATELSHIVITGESRQFDLSHLHTPPSWVTPFEFCRNLRRQKTWSPWVTVWRCLRDPTSSRFSRTPTCKRRTDRQTDTQRRHIASRGKEYMYTTQRKIQAGMYYSSPIITFCVSRRRRKMHCGHGRLCTSVCLSVCVSVRGLTPTLLHGPGCNLGSW